MKKILFMAVGLMFGTALQAQSAAPAAATDTQAPAEAAPPAPTPVAAPTGQATPSATDATAPAETAAAADEAQGAKHKRKSKGASK